MAGQPAHYYKAFDGSRGIGTLFVIVAHYGYFQCGWVSVQYFFVLSGFLITSILLRQREQPPGQYFRNFYWRRVLRIFPVYFGYLALSALALALFGEPKSLSKVWPWLCTYTYNLYMMVPGSVLDKFFAHLWSLSAEEQFYLVWPFIIFFLRGRALKALILLILVAVPLLRIALYALATHNDVSPSVVGRAIYLGTMFQLDGFAAGAAIAIWKLERLKFAERWFGLALALTLLYAAVATILEPAATPAAASTGAHTAVGLVRTGASFGFPLLMVPHAQFLWAYSALNLLSALFIIVMCRQNLATRILENRFLCYLGKMSYGMYVLHFPVQYVFLKFVPVDAKTLPGFLAMFAMIGIIIALAHLSFFYYEARFLELKDKLFAYRAPDPQRQ